MTKDEIINRRDAILKSGRNLENSSAEELTENVIRIGEVFFTIVVNGNLVDVAVASPFPKKVAKATARNPFFRFWVLSNYGTTEVDAWVVYEFMVYTILFPDTLLVSLPRSPSVSVNPPRTYTFSFEMR